MAGCIMWDQRKKRSEKWWLRQSGRDRSSWSVTWMTSVTTWDRRRPFTGFRVNTTGLALSRMLWIGYAVVAIIPMNGDVVHLCLPVYKSLYLLFQIKVCETCQHAERNKNLARTVRPIKVDSPWEILAIEIIGKRNF